MKILPMAVSVFFLTVCSMFAQDSGDNASTAPTDSQANRQPAKVKTTQLFWIFLTTGKSSKDVEPKKIQEMQAAHLANFKLLAEKGQLLTAGPMDDPAKNLRGIVVVRAKDQDELLDYFKDDPYVQKGYLNVEATEMQFEHGVINTKITPQGLEEYRIVILNKNEKGDPPSEESAKANRQFISKLSSNDKLLMTAYLPKSESARQAILIMTKPEKEESVAEIVNDIPAVKSGAWKSNIYKLYMGKGTLSAS